MYNMRTSCQKMNKRIEERREGLPKTQQQSKAKSGHSVNRGTSETVEKSPKIGHVVEKKNPEPGTAQTFTEHNVIPQIIVSFNNVLGLNVSQEL